MKKIIALSGMLCATIFAALPCFAQGNKNKATTYSTAATTARLQRFYYFYITEAFEKLKPNKQLNDTLKEYCTTSFLRKINNDHEMDADPFTHTQDIDNTWRETLTITKTDNTPTYKMCMLSTYDHKNYCVKIMLKKENGKWKIDNVHE